VPSSVSAERRTHNYEDAAARMARKRVRGRGPLKKKCISQGIRPSLHSKHALCPPQERAPRPVGASPLQLGPIQPGQTPYARRLRRSAPWAAPVQCDPRHQRHVDLARSAAHEWANVCAGRLIWQSSDPFLILQFAAQQQRGYKVAVLGAAGGIGQVRELPPQTGIRSVPSCTSRHNVQAQRAGSGVVRMIDLSFQSAVPAPPGKHSFLNPVRGLCGVAAALAPHEAQPQGHRAFVLRRCPRYPR
jgi:hypothetical protein